MRALSGVTLGVTTIATIAVMWVRAKWATTIPESAMCLLGVVWAIALLSGRTKVRLAWVMAPLAAVIGLAILQVATGITVYAWPTTMAALYWTGSLATVFVGLQVFEDRDRRVGYLDALLVFGCLLAVLSTAQAMTSQGMIYWTFPDKLVPDAIFGPFLYANQFAAFIELVLPLAIYNAVTRDKGKFLYVMAAAILFGSVLYSGSRGGAGITLAEIVVVPLLTARRRDISRKHLLNLGAVLVVGLLWVWVVAGPDKLIGKVGAADPFLGRREFNISSLAMIRERPLQGFGLGNWATAYPGYASFDDGLYANQAHNDWAQWTVEGGIPMLLLMLAVAVWAVPRAVRSGWGLGVAAIFIHCLADYPIQRTGVAIVFFTMMAAIAPYGRPSQPSSPK
ncbi:MAG TPA: O-antigen ligase family protein [Bryobacteraceae bacterium]|nr:O-antigen ligase family protein [Bryobacteraceae bacterium]